MVRTRILFLTLLAMLAFAGNSILCRLALRNTAIDPASFTTVRLLCGAFALYAIVSARGGKPSAAGNWGSALALFAYAACFSFGYVALTTATGALILFGAVQVTMIGYGIWKGERLQALQIAGMACAFGGLIGLVLPGLEAPPLLQALLMLGAGCAWGIYSLRGKGAADATAVTAGNFLRAALITIALSLAALPWIRPDMAGAGYAALSGALTSGVGYVIWYSALRGLTASSAATVQLSVPLLAALGGVVLLDEAFTLRLLLASVAILGGVALVILHRGRA